MYKFELDDGGEPSNIDYRKLRSLNYSKTKIYCLLLMCFLIICFLVSVLVSFVYDDISPNTDTSPENNSYMLPQNVSNNPNPYYETADGNGTAISTERPQKNMFRKLHMKIFKKPNVSGNSDPEHTSTRTRGSSPVISDEGETSPVPDVSTTKTPAQISSPELPSSPVSTKPSALPTKPSQATVPTLTPEINADYQCGRRRIIENPYNTTKSPDEGINTYFGEFPWMLVLLYFNKSNDNALKCGASLIAPDVALTAAHCVNLQYGLLYSVRAGDWYLDGNLKKEYLPPQERDVAAIKIHPDFSTKTLENNIALLQLSSNIDYDDHIRPICLADWNVEYDSDNCIVTGWGRDSAEDTTHHEFLRQVGLSLVSRDECQQKLRNSELHYFHLNEGDICALNASSSVSSCKGDGGGPLICPSKKNPAIYVQVGISTWSVACAPDMPGLYTNIEYYRDWIDETVKEIGGSEDLAKVHALKGSKDKNQSWNQEKDERSD
ncbi:hypothetical protein M8J76_014682 [Diaphorina citri]|nr:hypothetical protein M8J76_014682 [Diaphorina citri]